MGYLDRLRQRVGEYAPADHPRILEFRRRIWQDRDQELDRAYWDWLVMRNPNLHGQKPAVWLVKERDVVVGLQSSIPRVLKVGTRRVRCSWAVDLMVEPGARGAGLGAVLTERLREATDVTLGLGVSEAARAMYVRGGWTDMDTVPRYVKLLRSGPYLGRHGSRALAGVLGAGIDGFLRLKDRVQATGATGREAALPVVQLERFDARFDRLWERVSGEYEVVVQRDASTLNWRFRDCPGVRFVVLALAPAGELAGYVVLWERVEDVGPVAYVVDCFAAPADVGRLVTAAVEHSRGLGVAAVVFHVLGPAVEARLLELGFSRRPSHLRFMVADGRDEAVAEAVRRPSSWLLTYSDSDGAKPWAVEANGT